MPRPTIFTKEVLQKLEYAFAMDCTDEESCLYAGISPSSLYNYQAQKPEFLERKKLLRQTPVLKARTALVEALEKDPELSLKYLERKRKDEFSPKQITEVKSEPIERIEQTDELKEFTRKYEEGIREIILRGPKK